MSGACWVLESLRAAKTSNFRPQGACIQGGHRQVNNYNRGALGAIGETTNPDMGLAWLASEPPIVIDAEPFGKKACETSRTLHRAPNHPLWKVPNRRADAAWASKQKGVIFSLGLDNTTPGRAESS